MFGRRAKDDLPDPSDENWERALITRMAADYLREQQRRRWDWLFKGAAAIVGVVGLYVLLLGIAYAYQELGDLEETEDHTALIEVKGLISSETNASADRIVKALRDAFDNDKVKGIILRINSPGGSPVQSGYINDEIKRLKAEYKEDNDKDMPVYAVAVDLCASGGYYIAVAADEIYADKASIVGSIGVRMDGFGFEDAMHELGVERRLLTAGDNKAILDPFSPMSETDREFLQGMLDNIHQQFIDAVKTGRGERLSGGDEVFSGLFWSGEKALDLGLVDGLGNASYVARELIGEEKIVVYTKKKDLFERLAERVGTSIGEQIMAAGGLGRPVELR